ncbi:MAG: AI-2E family transporter [Anaerolineae bacterium]|jgi:predicted PurR-regulated permease PerM|nr:AI-2E family transporter [Anaerolineae bacterium]
MKRIVRSSSPPWSDSNKRLVLLILLLLLALALYRFRLLLLPLSMAMILAYLIDPLVNQLTKRTPLTRNMSIGIIYLLLVAALVSIPVSTISPIVTQVTNFIHRTPQYISDIGEFFRDPIVIADGIVIPVDQLSLDQLFASLSSNLVEVVQTLGGQTLSIFGSLASATISTVGWTIMVLFLSFYLVKDHHTLFDSIVKMAPRSYQEDLIQLSEGISVTWNAFLRGQLVLCLVVGTIIFIIALIIGLPNAITLGVIAGLMELIPTFGPILAAIPAVLIAAIQGEASWLGSFMSPFWFAVLVLGIYGFVYQFENYYLVPRIIGHHLKLHPLVVVLGVLAGASVAGVLGILLAAPVLASARLIWLYIYCKLTDQDPFSDEFMPFITLRRQAKTAVPPPPQPTTTPGNQDNPDTTAAAS